MIKKTTFYLTLVILFFSTTSFKNTKAGFSITTMKCEYLSDPLGLDTQKPRFTWNY